MFSLPGNRPYACTMCDKKFAARSNLIQHRMVHKRPFNCNMCNKRFDKEDQLKKHLFAHPQALLTCNFCTYAATSQSDLNKHMVEHHPPQVMDTRGSTPVKNEPHQNGDLSSSEDGVVPDQNGGDPGKSPAGSSGTGSGDYGDHRDVMTPHLMQHNVPPLSSPSPLPSVQTSTQQGLTPPAAPLPNTQQALSLQTSLQPPAPLNVPQMSQFSPRSLSQTTDAGLFSPKSLGQAGLDHRGSRVDTICSQLITSVAHGPSNPSNLPSNPSHTPYPTPAPLPSPGTSLPPASSLQAHSALPPVSIPPPTLPSMDHDLFKGVTVKKEVEDYTDMSCNGATCASDSHGLSAATQVPRPGEDITSPQNIPYTAMYSSADLMRATSSSVPPSTVYSNLASTTPSTTVTSVPSFASSFGSGAKPPGPATPTLPAIHEVFSRRSQRIPPTFANFSVPAMLSPDRLNMNLSHSGELPASLLSSPPISSTSTNALSTSTTPTTSTPSLNLPTLSSVQQSGNRPMAQLPPIAQVLRQPKDAAVQHAAPVPGIPALDEILAYYINQGKLFKCQYCNILFYERGMYFLHASLHGQSSPWECSICHKLCMDKNEFTIHFVNQQHTGL